MYCYPIEHHAHHPGGPVTSTFSIDVPTVTGTVVGSSEAVSHGVSSVFTSTFPTSVDVSEGVPTTTLVVGSSSAI